MPALTLANGHQPDGSITYVAQGYNTDPCPGCGEKLTPGQQRQVMPGVWLPHHSACWGPELDCDWCDERHPHPHDGSCLL